MKTDTKVCIGVTIAILAALIIGGMTSLSTVKTTLGIIGFLFLMGLPTYVWARRRDGQTRSHIDYEQRMESVRRNEVLQETRDCLDDSIEAFKTWGWHLKDSDKSDEMGYYGDIAKQREASGYGGGLSAEYGRDVSCLIDIRRKLDSIRYDL
jgi:hypothetical protein